MIWPNKDIMAKKILILANNSGGLYDFRCDLIRALMQKGEVVASTPFDSRMDELRAMNFRLIETPVDRRGINPATDFKLMLNYLRMLRRENPDMVVTYTIKPNVYGGAMCRLLGKNYAANITGLGTAFEGDGMLRKIVTMMYRFALKKAKVVFFENSANLDLFVNEKIIRREQTCLLSGAGVNLERFPVQKYPENDGVKFLFIGRVMAEKGVNELFTAMQKLHSEGVNCTLDALGYFDEDYSEKIKTYEAEGWLRYHGFQKDVKPFIAGCDCFVLPSWHEGMANTNLECASSGRPLITSNIPGCKEAVIDGESGFLCESKNAESLYAAMKKMCACTREDREKMGLAGRRHMEKTFDKNVVVANTVNALKL